MDKNLLSCSTRLAKLRHEYETTFNNVSSFNPMSQIIIQTKLPAMQNELRSIARIMDSINVYSLSEADLGQYQYLKVIFNDLKDGLF